MSSCASLPLIKGSNYSNNKAESRFPFCAVNTLRFTIQHFLHLSKSPKIFLSSHITQFTTTHHLAKSFFDLSTVASFASHAAHSRQISPFSFLSQFHPLLHSCYPTHFTLISQLSVLIILMGRKKAKVEPTEDNHLVSLGEIKPLAPLPAQSDPAPTDTTSSSKKLIVHIAGLIHS